MISEIYEQATGKPIHFRTARSWLTEWLEDKKHEKISEQTANRYDVNPLMSFRALQLSIRQTHEHAGEFKEW